MSTHEDDRHIANTRCASEVVTNAGTLERIQLGYDPDLSRGPQSIVLSFSRLTLSIAIDEIDSTIRASTIAGGESSLRDVSDIELWKHAVGCVPLWIWAMTNHRGYDDGFQLQFGAPDGTPTVRIQIIASGSLLDIACVQEREEM